MNSRADPARPYPAGAPSIADVAVIGGGIVGAAAALGAAQAGLQTLWVAGRQPAAPDPRVDGARDQRVYALGPATQRFLEDLRVWSRLDASRLAPVFDMRVFGDDASRSSVHFGAYETATERLATIVEHRELASALDTAAHYFAGIERIDGLVSQVEVDDDHAVVITERGPRQARLVVAADGAHSRTREAFGIATVAKVYAQRAVIGNFACALPHRGCAFQWFTDDGVVALLPLGPLADQQAAVSLVWSAPEAVAEGLVLAGADAVANRLTVLAEAQVGALRAIGPLAHVPLAMQNARRMIAPRGALVGDAAHVVHPLAGQGLNLGLQDVDALLTVLRERESFRDCGDVRLLRRYERQRAEPVLAMSRAIEGLDLLFNTKQPGFATLRRTGLRIVDRLPSLKRVLARQAAVS